MDKLQPYLDSFDMNTFDVNKYQNMKYDEWTNNDRFQLILYIMTVNKLKSFYKITSRQLNKFKKSYTTIYDKHRVMVSVVLKEKCIDVNDDNFFIRSQNIVPQTIDDNVDVNFEDDLKNFDISTFNVSYYEHLTFDKWTIMDRYKMILYVMKVNKLQTVYDITSRQIMQFLKSFDAIYKKHSAMIKDVFQKLKIQVDENKFKLCSKDMQKINEDNANKLWEAALVYSPTETELQNKKDAIIIIKEEIPKIVQDLNENGINNFLSYRFDKFEDDAIVYIAYQHSTKKILYVGSSNDFSHREGSHKSLFETSLVGKRYSTEFYNYVKENNTSSKDIEIIPILKCELGFEKLFECEFYDLFKLIQDNPLIKLLNGPRPFRNIFSIESQSLIYAFVDDMDNEKILYIGSTNDSHERMITYVKNCYVDKHQTKLFKFVIQRGPEEWPASIRMKGIEQCPIFLRFHREKFYIDKFDVIENGLNAQNIIIGKNKAEHRKQVETEYRKNNKDKIQAYHKQLREKKGDELRAKSRAHYAANKEQKKEYQQQNKEKILARKAEQVSCDWCNSAMRRDSLSKHKKICPKKPVLTGANNNEAGSSSDPLPSAPSN